MVKSSGSCLGFGQRVAGDAAAEGGLVLVRYVDVEGADLGRAVDACHVDLRLMDGRVDDAIVETGALRGCGDDSTILPELPLPVNAAHRIAMS